MMIVRTVLPVDLRSRWLRALGILLCVIIGLCSGNAAWRSVVVVIALLVTVSSCSSQPTESDGPALDTSHQVAGAIVRVSIGDSTYDLRIAEMAPRSDAGGDPPPCVRKIKGSQYDLNWTAAAHAADGSVDAQVSISTASGRVLTVQNDSQHCRRLNDYPFELVPSDTQIVLGAGVAGEHPNILRVTVNGASHTVRLWRTCTEADYEATAAATPRCADDPLNFDPLSVYAVRLRT